MPIAYIRPPRHLGQGTFGPGAVCLDSDEQQISCVDERCSYGDCGSTMPPLSGNLCLGPTVNGVESQIDCSSPMCTYGDCLQPGQTGYQNLPQNRLPNTTQPPIINYSPSPRVPAQTPIQAPMASPFTWFGQSTNIGGMIVPNWAMVALPLGAIALAGAFRARGRR